MSLKYNVKNCPTNVQTAACCQLEKGCGGMRTQNVANAWHRKRKEKNLQTCWLQFPCFCEHTWNKTLGSGRGLLGWAEPGLGCVSSVPTIRTQSLIHVCHIGYTKRAAAPVIQTGESRHASPRTALSICTFAVKLCTCCVWSQPLSATPWVKQQRPSQPNRPAEEMSRSRSSTFPTSTACSIPSKCSHDLKISPWLLMIRVEFPSWFKFEMKEFFFLSAAH